MQLYMSYQAVINIQRVSSLGHDDDIYTVAGYT
jgi:hypothetical protein